MDIKRAKDYLSLGIITGATVQSANLMHPDGWTIEFSGKFGEANPLFETIRGDVRKFKTLDACAKVLVEIGFKKWSVQV